MFEIFYRERVWTFESVRPISTQWPQEKILCDYISFHHQFDAVNYSQIFIIGAPTG